MNIGIVRCAVLSVLFVFNQKKKENANMKYRSYMTKHGVVEIDAEGWGIFTCFANEVQVWVKAARGDNLNQ
jgi:hypothetical protein